MVLIENIDSGNNCYFLFHLLIHFVVKFYFLIEVSHYYEA